MAVKIPSMLGKMSPTFQKAWYKKNKMPIPVHLTGSVKQASKEVKQSERAKGLQAKSLKAYGATKGLKVGGEHGSGEMKDTIAPLTRDQHSKVQAAERAAKAAAKASTVKRTKPLSKSERMAAIAAAARKVKTKHDVPTVDPEDADHDDLRDVHQSLHIHKGSYSESVDRMAIIKALASKNKMNKPVSLTRKPKSSTKKMMQHYGYIDDVTGYKVKEKSPGGMNRFEETESNKKPSNYPGQRLQRDYLDRFKTKPKEDWKTKQDREYGLATGYKAGRWAHGGKYEEVEMSEVTKKEAEKVLGGPVKEKPKMPPGKQPEGYRYVRSLARKAMKAGTLDAVHKSMERTMERNMKKEEVEQEVDQIIEQDDSMEKKEMAQTQLHFIKYAAEEILEFIDMGGEIEEWYQNKLSKVQSEVESLHSYIEGEKRRTGMVKEEEQIDEKAPPGAKFERMVKHIKKGYAKGGLTKQEKSIAYATAWKAYKKNEEVKVTEETEQVDEKYMGFKKVMASVAAKGARNPAAVAAAIGRKKYGKEKFQAMAAAGKKAANEETEVVAEAEGTVAVTPKEKALAAHHGDPKKITYGDVIKARLKSAAAKKMGK